jgi:plasmid replication initiation protein
MVKKPKTTDIHDELNFARFGVISMHSRLDKTITSWHSEYTPFRTAPSGSNRSPRRAGRTVSTRTR